MAIEVQLIVSGGAPQTGGVTCTATDTVQARLNPNTDSGVWVVLWELYEYPPTATTPAGWTADAAGQRFYYLATAATALMPPVVNLTGQPWGKWLLRATANNGVMGGAVNLAEARSELTAFETLSPSGIEDVGAQEAEQFYTFGKIEALKQNLRKLDGGVIVVTAPPFNADPTGTVSSDAAFGAALAVIAAAGRGVLYIPPGDFLVESYLNLTGIDNLVIRGAGAGVSRLVKSAGDTTHNCFIRDYTGGHSNLIIEDVGFWGNGQNEPTDLAEAALVQLRYQTNCRVLRCHFMWSRFFSLQITQSQGVTVRDCVVEHSARDGIAVWSSSGVLIEGNTVKHCGDDTISAHTSLTDAEPARSGLRIVGNHVEDGQGIKAISAKGLVCSHNVVRRTSGHGIRIGIGSPDVQGDEPSHSVKVEGNLIEDVIETQWFVDGNTGNVNNSTYLLVGSFELNDGGDLAVPPGDVDPATGEGIPIYGYMYELDTDETGGHSGGTWFVQIRGNTLVRTLGNVTNYSDWGYGEANAVAACSTVDYDITEIDMHAAAIKLLVPMRQVLVEGNLCQTGRQGIIIERAAGQSLTDLLARGVVIRNNTFFDCIVAGVGWSEGSATHQDITIEGNWFDLDPWFQSAYRNSPLDGKWGTTGTYPYGVVAQSMTGVKLLRNHFRNLNTLTLIATGGYYAEGNVLHAYPVSVGTLANNIGISDCKRPGVEWHYVIEDCNPTSATYGHVLNNCPKSASAQPTSGYWYNGQIVISTLPNDSVNGQVWGWKRRTTGSGHVAGTDWIEMIVPYGTNGTPYAANVGLVSGAGTVGELAAFGSATNIDVQLTPKGTGRARFGTHQAVTTEVVSGYIEIKDAAGNTRKIAVVS